MEALTNVRRHAPGAKDVRVDVCVDDAGGLVVRVVNDGVDQVTPTREGYGLVGMTERVTALGGTCTAGRTPDGRWQVLARVPLDAS
jgi:signal transduction histidine kinase